MIFQFATRTAAAVAVTTNRRVTIRQLLLRGGNDNDQLLRSKAMTVIQQQRGLYYTSNCSDYNVNEPMNIKSVENYTKHGAKIVSATSAARWITFYAPTRPTFEKIIVNVPTMGDSITEGTIVEWTAAVGQAVKTDDVIALIETDKVTIDIKADRDGVIAQHFGSVDETVEVGAKLYELDTDAVASVSAPTAAPQITTLSTPSEKAPVEATATPPVVTSATADHRSPSIKFLGKQGWEALLKGHPPIVDKQPLNGSSNLPLKKHAVTIIIDDKNVKDPMYGRPKFTEAEIEALLTGGATLAPQVLSHSTGAKFKL